MIHTYIKDYLCGELLKPVHVKLSVGVNHVGENHVGTNLHF